MELKKIILSHARTLSKWVKWIRKYWIPITVLFLIFSLYCAFFNKVEPNEVGLARNRINGKTWVQKAGWHITAPWVWVATIKTNPIRVGVPTAGRGFSAKLIQFVPKYYDEFLEQEGWRWYWWDNRFSINFGHEDEYRGFRNIMLGYAYSKKSYPFIVVLEEYDDE